MPREEAEPSTSGRRRDVKRDRLLNPPAHLARTRRLYHHMVHSTARMHYGKVRPRVVIPTDLLKQKDVLPLWPQFQLSDGKTQLSRQRAHKIFVESASLPGVRLGGPKYSTGIEFFMVEHRSYWTARFWMRMTLLTTRSVQLCQPTTLWMNLTQELDAGVPYRRSLLMRMDPLMFRHQLQCDEHIRRLIGFEVPDVNHLSGPLIRHRDDFHHGKYKRSSALV
jgi:hypothetical protein